MADEEIYDYLTNYSNLLTNTPGWYILSSYIDNQRISYITSFFLPCITRGTLSLFILIAKDKVRMSPHD